MIKSFIDDKNEITITTPEGQKKKVTIVQKQIVFWSRNFAEKASYEREKGIAKLNKALQLESFNKKMTYGFTSKYIDKDYVSKDGEIIEAYRTLWQIEESFRITKTTLRTRPMYHSLEKAIKGHFLICMTALLFIRMVEKKKLHSKVCSTRLVDSLRKYQCLKQKDNKYQLLYIDEVLQIMAENYSIKLNQHYESEA